MRFLKYFYTASINFVILNELIPEMYSIKHLYHIDASTEDVFKALTTIEGLHQLVVMVMRGITTVGIICTGSWVSAMDPNRSTSSTATMAATGLPSASRVRVMVVPARSRPF